MNLGTGKIEELGRRAVACKHWRWLPGMTYVYENAASGGGPVWEDHSDDEECGGGRHWSEYEAEQYTAWKMPKPVHTYKDNYWIDDGWACYAESVLRGARTVDLPGTKFNPYNLEYADYVGGFDDRTAIGFPDFTDPATLGCLLALVREAWGQPALSVTAGYTKDRKVEWEVEHPHPDSLPEALWAYFDTEAEALVAALEAAP